MSVEAFLAWLGDTAPAGAVRNVLYPYVRAMHVGGAGILFGSIFLFDLRVLSHGGAASVEVVHSLTMRFVWTGFAIAVAGGMLLFLAQPQALWENGALRLKLMLLGLAGLNALFFEWGFRQGIVPYLLRVSAALSLTTWGCILVFSALIPYWMF